MIMQLRLTWPCVALSQVGMRHFNIRKNQYFQPIINLDKLWSLLGNEVRAILPTLLSACQACAVRMVPCMPIPGSKAEHEDMGRALHSSA